MFDRPFSFNGRIRRTEYGISLIIFGFLYLIIMGMDESSRDSGLIGFVLIPLVWFIWAQGAKRCHDLDNSGWWQLIPFYGLWLLFQDGQRYPNAYGDNPKGINDYSDSFEYDYPKASIPSEKLEEVIVAESDSISTTLLEVQNASYSNLQDIIKRFRTINRVHQLSYEYIGTTGDVKINHLGSSQELLEEFHSIAPNNDVLGVSDGKIVIKLK